MSRERIHQKPEAAIEQKPEQDYRHIGRIHYASDNEILNGCEAGVLDWKYSELAELGTTAEDQLSDQAKEARAVAYILLSQSKKQSVDELNEEQARQEYQKLLQDSERTILYMAERVDKLYDQKLLASDEYEEFKKTNNVTPLIRALTSGLSRAEATVYARLAKTHAADHKLSPGDDKKLCSLRAKIDGLTDEEIEEYVAIVTRPGYQAKDISRYLQNRKLGFSPELARRLDDLVERFNELTRKEMIEHTALINLRDSLPFKDPEVILAVREFGVEKLFDYILLRTKEKGAFDASDALIPRGQAFPHDPQDMAQLQMNIDAAHEMNKLNEDDERNLQTFVTMLRKEPLLRRFIHQWQSSFFELIRRSR